MTEGLERVYEGEVVEELPVEHYIDQGPNYVRFAPNTPFPVWHAYVGHLSRVEKGAMWWIGDSLIFGEQKYGEIAAQADESDFSRQTYYQAKWVCNRIEVSRRRETLSFAHHVEVAALEKEEQDEWLDKAEPGEGVTSPTLSRNALRKAIKDAAKKRRIGAAEGAEGEDRQAAPEVQAGEWWRLGEHVLFCGDSSSEEFRDAVPREAALAFADPPYNAGVAQWDHGFFWKHDYLVEGARVVAVTPGIASLFDFARVTNMPYRWSLAGFISNGMTRGAVGYGNWVYAALFSREGVYRQAQDAIRFAIKTSETSETDHKGRKPAEFVAYVVDTFSRKGEWVVDPFAGSGTTLFVCEGLGRKAFMAEIEPGYCGGIVGRWQSRTGLEAERLA